MKKRIIQSLMATAVLTMFCLLNCGESTKQNSNNFEEDTQVYCVLVEKAMTLQADFEIEAWADMLADDVVYSFPDYGERSQNNCVGKTAVITYWQNWRQSHHVKTVTFSGFTHAPFVSSKNLNVAKMSGVYVFSILTSSMVFTNNETVEIYMNYCCHFNKDKQIDRIYTNYDRIHIEQVHGTLSHLPQSDNLPIKGFRTMNYIVEEPL